MSVSESSDRSMRLVSRGAALLGAPSHEAIERGSIDRFLTEVRAAEGLPFLVEEEAAIIFRAWSLCLEVLLFSGENPDEHEFLMVSAHALASSLRAGGEHAEYCSGFAANIAGLLVSTSLHAGRLIEPSAVETFAINLMLQWFRGLGTWESDLELLAVGRFLHYFQAVDLEGRISFSSEIQDLVCRQRLLPPTPKLLEVVEQNGHIAVPFAESMLSILIQRTAKSYGDIDSHVVNVIGKWVDAIESPLMADLPSYTRADLLNMISISLTGISEDNSVPPSTVEAMMRGVTDAGSNLGSEGKLFRLEGLVSRILRNRSDTEAINDIRRLKAEMDGSESNRFKIAVIEFELVMNEGWTKLADDLVRSLDLGEIDLKEFGTLVRLGRALIKIGAWSDARTPLKIACLLIGERRLMATTWRDWLAAAVGFPNVPADYIVAIVQGCLVQNPNEAAQVLCDTCNNELMWALQIYRSNLLAQGDVDPSELATADEVVQLEIFGSEQSCVALAIDRKRQSVFVKRFDLRYTGEDLGDAYRRHSDRPDVDSLDRLSDIVWRAGTAEIFTGCQRSVKGSNRWFTWPSSTILQFIPLDDRTVFGEVPWCWSSAGSTDIARTKAVSPLPVGVLTHLSAGGLAALPMEREIWSGVSGTEGRDLTREAFFRCLERGGSLLHLSSHASGTERSDSPVLMFADGDELLLEEVFDCHVEEFGSIVVSGCSSAVAHPGAISAGLSLASALGYRGRCPVFGTARKVTDKGAACFGISLWLSLIEQRKDPISAWWEIVKSAACGIFDQYWQNSVWGSQVLSFDQQMILSHLMDHGSFSIAREIMAFRLIV